MRVALALAGCNRFVLRSACALYVQQGELDHAIALLRGCPSVEQDPWLLAPLVAISGLAGAKQVAARSAKEMLKDHQPARNLAELVAARSAKEMLKDHQPARNLAELAAAVATIELDHGSARRGRQLLRMSVENPTENALAQAEWLGQLSKETFIEDMPAEVPRNFEATARRAAFEAKWSVALDNASLWAEDQPFSVEAFTFASYCASERQDFDGALKFAGDGLTLQRDNPMLLNNQAFAMIELGRPVEAVDPLVRARKAAHAEKFHHAVRTATEALLLFRVGRIDIGRERYQTAVQMLDRLDLREQAARAALMLAREEAIAGTTEAEAAWKRAQGLAGNWPTDVVRDLLQRVEKERLSLQQMVRRAGPQEPNMTFNLIADEQGEMRTRGGGSSS
jgi:hypothetical protein